MSIPYSLLKTIQVDDFRAGGLVRTKGTGGDIHKNRMSHLFSNPVNTEWKHYIYQQLHLSRVFPPPHHFFFVLFFSPPLLSCLSLQRSGLQQHTKGKRETEYTHKHTQKNARTCLVVPLYILLVVEN